MTVAPSNPLQRLMAVVALLLVAFGLRVALIDQVPPGLTHDEISQLDTAAQVRAGDWRLLYPGGFAADGAEPGYYPFLSASQAIWGTSPLARRLPSIFAGMLGLACIYTLARRLFSWRIAVIALGAATAVWWSILLGRVILREILEVPLYALALYGFWRGFDAARSTGERPRLRSFVLGGAALGLLQYVHTIPRGLFLVFVLFGAYLLFFHRALLKLAWRGLVVLIVVAEVIAAPLLITASLNPDLDNKPTLTSLQLTGQDGLIQRFQSNTAWIVGQFAFAGDDAWEFNLPYRPIFEPIVAAFFGLGILGALLRFRRPAMAFVLIVLFVSLLPSIFLKAAFPFGRLASAQTVVFTFVALGLDLTWSGLSRFVGNRLTLSLVGALLGSLYVLTLIGTVRDMFIAWPQQNGTQSVYNMELRDFGKYLDAQSQPLPVSQCVLWIIYPWRPRYHLAVQQAALPYLTQRRDLDIRWHDCRHSLVIPNGGQFLYAHTDLEPLSMFLGRFLQKPWLQNAQPVVGLNGVLQVDARSALADQLNQWKSLTVIWPPEATATAPAHLPIDFNHSVELIGYQIKPQTPKPGSSLAVVTYWRVTAALPDDLLLFTHLYRTPTEVMAQQDQLDVDGSSLKPGDVFMQVHEFVNVPADVPAGSYWIGIGLYHKDSGERLPVYLGDQRVADRLFLAQVQVTP